MAREFVQTDDGFFVMAGETIVARDEEARAEYAAYIAAEQAKVANPSPREKLAALSDEQAAKLLALIGA